MDKRWIFNAVWLAASLGTWPLAASAGHPAAAAPGVSAHELRIGMVNAQSGPASSLGQGMLAGAQAVFADINANGGVHGRQIKLLVADDGYEPDRTVLETLKMVQDENVLSLFGYVGTPTSNAALPLVQDLKVPLVGLFTGAMTLREPVTREVFNVRASYDDEAEALVAHLLARGAQSIGVIYQFDGFGLAVLSGVDKALKRRGLKIKATGSFQRNTLAVQAAAGEMMEARPDAVVMAGPYTPVAALVRKLRGAGLKSQLATVSFVGTDSLIDLLGIEGNGLMVSQVVPFPHDDQDARTSSCRKLLRQHAKAELGFVNFEGCISAKLLVEGLRGAGQHPTRDGLIRALEALGSETREVDGLPVNWTKDSHQASLRVFLTEIRNGAIADLGETP